MENEKRLIDANALLENVQFRLPDKGRISEIIRECVEICRKDIENAPTVDAVEVVRCKDCKWYRQYSDVWDCAYGNGMNFPHDNCFCSYGERRTE